MSSSPVDDNLKHLAQDLAFGDSAAAWATRHDCDVQTVQEWCTLKEFHELVDAHRMRAADQMVGRLMSAAASAIDQIEDAARHSTADHLKVSAARNLLDKWLGVSQRFEQTMKIAALQATIKSWEQATANGRLHRTP